MVVVDDDVDDDDGGGCCGECVCERHGLQRITREE